MKKRINYKFKEKEILEIIKTYIDTTYLQSSFQISKYKAIIA